MKVLIFWVGVFVAMVFVFNIAIERMERSECVGWLEDQTKFDGWFSVDWQKDQCKAYGIEFEK